MTLRSITRALCATLLAFSGALAVPASAQIPDDVVEATLIPGWRMQSGNHMTALRLRLAPGWKTYWRAPGDAGIPPRFDWAGSNNLLAAKPHWPVPEVYYINGLRSVGYDGEVIIPLELMPEAPGDPITLTGQIEIGVCEEICIPISLNVGADLVTGQTAPDAEIAQTLGRRPLTRDEAGVAAARCRAEPISDGLRLTAEIDMPALSHDEEAVVEFADKTVWISTPDSQRSGGTLTLVADLVPVDGAPFILARSDLRFTVLGGGQAVDILGCTAAS